MKPNRITCWMLFQSIVLLLIARDNPPTYRQKINFNHGWEFIRLENNTTEQSAQAPKALYDTTRTDFSSQFLNEYIQKGTAASSEIIRQEIDAAIKHFQQEFPSLTNQPWTQVSLPHTAIVEPITNKTSCWEGVCYYKKSLTNLSSFLSKRVVVEFEGAMQQSDVWINRQLVLQHKGGYTPFSLDISPWIKRNQAIEIIVRLDNRADKNFPIGKDLKRNGFTYWSGIYRNVNLYVTEPVYITDAVKENITAGGGVFFRTPQVSATQASVIVKTHIANQLDVSKTIKVKQELLNAQGKVVREHISDAQLLQAQSKWSVEQSFTVDQPALWSPDCPDLYTLRTSLLSKNGVFDKVEQRVGFRKLAFTANGFVLNGIPMRLVGTNLHQDYPYIGVALSKNAHYRDMKKIKEAGYNAVRLAHYPHDPSVYEAADELGLMLIDGIPGWQFFNKNSLFVERAMRDMRDMIHRDRNHPSVVLWEVNMNECYPPVDFRNASHALAHEELPAGEYFTTGETYGAKGTIWDVPMNNWSDSPDSIYRNTVERAQNVQPGYPSVIKEYADWEFGGWASTTRSSRQTGEISMRQGLWNTMWSHNANRANYGPATVGDFTWAMFDNYISGDKKLFEWGTYDYFRLPKFTSYLFRSQLDPYKNIAGIDSNQPVLYIANWWTENSASSKVIVLSNCDKIVLKINNQIVAEQLPDAGPNTYYGLPDKGGKPWDGGNCTQLPHPPFTFSNIAFAPGELKAEGYINGVKVAETTIRTPEKPTTIALEVDESSKPLAADGADVVFVHAKLIDKNGTVACLDNSTEVCFTLLNDKMNKDILKIVSPTTVKVRGGIATILVQSASVKKGRVLLRATASGLKTATIKITTN